MARRTVSEYTPAYTPSWVRVFEWNGISPEDAVKVDGERGDWKFLSAHSTDGVVHSIEVIGGVGGERQVRAFRPERITKKAGRRGRKTFVPADEVDEEE